MAKYFLTFDIGNSNQSAALFDQSERFVKKVPFDGLKKLIKEYEISVTNAFGIVSSVKDSNLDDIPVKYQLARRLLLHKKFLEMPVDYSETIGDDRLVIGYFLFKQNTNDKVIIDSGTFTTVDFVNEQGFSGGYILPGKDKLNEIYKYGAHLKTFVRSNPNQDKLSDEIPNTSEDAIEQGAMAALLFPIQGLIEKFGGKEIYITGGNGETVAAFLKPYAEKQGLKIFLAKDLIHRSLCYIAKRVER